MISELEHKIESKLSEYLEFDVKELFKGTDFFVVFGGAVRDIIVGDPINDIDIMCLSASKSKAISTLENMNYTQIDATSIGMSYLYSGINYIFEPITYINEHSKMVQLINPNFVNIMRRHGVNLGYQRNDSEKSINDYFKKVSFIKMLSNVDLSCCGVFWDGANLYESVPMSLQECLNKTYVKLEHSLMYSTTRVFSRMHKLDNRGWKQEFLPSNELRLERTNKIRSIFTDAPQIDDFIKKVGLDMNNDTINSYKDCFGKMANEQDLSNFF